MTHRILEGIQFHIDAKYLRDWMSFNIYFLERRLSLVTMSSRSLLLIEEEDVL
jgi:hypothetical protein